MIRLSFHRDLGRAGGNAITLPFYTVLLALPLIPLAVLVARDALYLKLGLPLVDTPKGSLAAWEFWVIGMVCWASVAVVAAADLALGTRDAAERRDSDNGAEAEPSSHARPIERDGHAPRQRGAEKDSARHDTHHA